MISKNKIARIAGALYLIYMIVFALADATRSKLIHMEDASATFINIQTSGGYFKIGFVSDIIAGFLFLLAVWTLYVLLRSVNQNVALLFLLLNAAGVTIQCLNTLNLYAVFLLSRGSEYLKYFQPDQLQAMAMYFIHLHESGFMISQFFFSAWLFPLGYVVYKSGFLPRILGIVLMVECFGWFLYPLQYFLFPSTMIVTISSTIGFIGEFSLTLWLLIKGVKQSKPALAEVDQ
jgi:hypothetical protein